MKKLTSLLLCLALILSMFTVPAQAATSTVLGRTVIFEQVQSSANNTVKGLSKGVPINGWYVWITYDADGFSDLYSALQNDNSELIIKYKGDYDLSATFTNGGSVSSVGCTDVVYEDGYNYAIFDTAAVKNMFTSYAANSANIKSDGSLKAPSAMSLDGRGNGGYDTIYGIYAVTALPVDPNFTTTATIDLNKTYQTIDGFGASYTWYSDWMTKIDMRHQGYDWIFNEAGFNILRFRDQHGLSGDEKNEPLKGYPNYRAYYDAAVERGIDPIVLVTSWGQYDRSLPFVQYIDKSANGYSYYTLAKNANGEYMYDELAEFCVQSIQYFFDAGLPVHYFSISNEIELQELHIDEQGNSRDSAGFFFGTEETDDRCAYWKAHIAVYDAFQKAFGDKAPSIIGAETMAGNNEIMHAYLDPLIERRPETLDVVAHHLYGTNLSERNFRKLYNGFSDYRMWQTEWYYNDYFHLAEVIVDELVNENITAYLYWNGVWPEDDGNCLIEISDWSQKATVTRMPAHYIMTHFSKFIKQGYKRVDVSEGLGSKVAAFKSPEGDKLVVVAANNTSTNDILNIKHGMNTVSSRVYQSTEADNTYMKDLGSFSDGLVLPAGSLTTIVMDIEDPVVPIVPASPDVMASANFENGVSGWSTNFNYTITDSDLVSDPLGINGRSLHIINRWNCWSAPLYSMNLEAGKTYRISTDVMYNEAPVNNGTVYTMPGFQHFQLQLCSDPANLSEYGSFNKEVRANEWTNLTAEFTIPETASGYAVLNIASAVGENPYNKVNFYVDNVLVEKVADKPNNNFENGVSGWSTNFNYTITDSDLVSDPLGINGRSLHIVNRWNCWSAPLYSMKNALCGGRTYRITADIMYNEDPVVNGQTYSKPSSQTFNLQLGSSIDSLEDIFVYSQDVPANTWTTVSTEVTLPYGVTDSLIFNIMTGGGTNPEGKLNYYLDNVSIDEVLPEADAPVYGPEIVANANFENGVHDWSTNFNYTITDSDLVSDPLGINGRSLHIINRWNCWSAPLYSMNLEAGKTYRISTDVMYNEAPVNNGTVYTMPGFQHFQLQLCSDPANLSEYGSFNKEVRANEWTNLTAEFTIPETASGYAVLNIASAVGENPYNKVNFYVDNVLVEKVADKPNNNFENGVSGWSTNFNYTITDSDLVSDPLGINGRSLHIVNRWNCWSAPLYSMKNALCGGRTYRITADIMYNEDPVVNGQTYSKPSSQTFNLQLGSSIDSLEDIFVYSQDVPANTWTTVSTEVTLPYGVTDSLIFNIMTGGGTNPEGKLNYYLDNVSIDEVLPEADVPVYAPELVANTNFENGISGWDSNFRGQLSNDDLASDPISYRGTSMHVINRWNCWSTNYCEVYLEAGRTYKIAADVMYNEAPVYDGATQNLPATQNFDIQLGTSANNLSDFYVHKQEITAGQWTTVITEITIPEGASGTYYFNVMTTGGDYPRNNMNYYLDNVSIKQVN